MIVKEKKHFKKYFGLMPSSVIYIYIYIYMYIYIYIIYINVYINIYIYLYSLRKSNNYSLKSAQYKSVIILWEEDDAK